MDTIVQPIVDKLSSTKMTDNNEHNDANGHGDLSQRNYIRWDQEGVEVIPQDEEEDIKEVARMINQIQEAQYKKHRHCYGMSSPPFLSSHSNLV